MHQDLASSEKSCGVVVHSDVLTCTMSETSAGWKGPENPTATATISIIKQGTLSIPWGSSCLLSCFGTAGSRRGRDWQAVCQIAPKLFRIKDQHLDLIKAVTKIRSDAEASTKADVLA